MAEIVFPEGIRIFAAKASQPDWVLGSIKIEPVKLINWLKLISPDATDVQLQIRESNSKKIYMCLDTWKPNQDQQQEQRRADTRPSLPMPANPAPCPPPAQFDDDDSIDDIPF